MSDASQLFTLALRSEALLFGEFTLKSGRQSPYFFNAGKLCDGEAIATLGALYANTLMREQVGFDVLLGPAYKGIPLAAATAAALFNDHGRNVPWAYNRKEAKGHGEGGVLVGAPLQGRVMVVDDVITAGTAIRESVATIHNAGATLAGVVVSLDRQERGAGELSAIQEVARDFDAPVFAVGQLSTLIAFVEADPALAEHLPKMVEYRQRYGVQ